MWRLAVAFGVLVLAGCGPPQGHEVAGGQVPSTRGDPAQAVGAALALVADSNPDAAAAFDGRSVGVDVRWDGRAWQAAAIAGRGG